MSDFILIKDVHQQLDVIESNLNVKKWIIDLWFGIIDQEAKERLQKILLERTDNSVYVHNRGGSLTCITQINQVFNISPVSDC